MRLPIVLALLCSAAPALAQVEVVRPTPRAVGTHGWTIEVPTPGAVGSFEVLRGGRLPDAAAAEEAIPVEPPTPAARSLGPQTLATGPRTIQIAPVRPVTVAPVGLHGRSQGAPDPQASARSGGQARDASTVRVQRGPFPQSLLSILGNSGGGADGAEQAVPAAPARSALPAGSAIPPLPPGARVIRIR